MGRVPPFCRLWTGFPIPIVALFVLQTTTPSPGVGPDELVDYWPAFRRLGWLLLGFLAVVVLTRVFLVPALARVLRRRNRNNPTIQDAILLYFRILMVVVAIFVGAGVAGYGRILSNSALVISAVALAIGVAAREVIGSLVSGVALVFDPEFNVGDHIEWSDGEGTIESIALRATRVKTNNGELITIPNTILTGQAITRPFGRGNYRVVDQIALAYDDDVDEAMAHLEDAALAIDGILAEPAPSVFLDELGDDAVTLRIHYWIDDPTRRDVYLIRSAYARQVKDRFEEAGISLSQPSEHDLQGRIEIDETGN